jgi:hypothetical protein
MMVSQPFPLEQDAVISECGRYRYLLTRQVGPSERAATFIMLNPSMADAINDDPTIRRCIGFARQWGCGRLAVLNVFAVRATDPADMRRAEDPVGPENKDWFDRTLPSAYEGPIVCAWGVHGEHMDQDLAVLGWLESYGIKPMSLGSTRDGHPRHPLYLPKTVDLAPFHRRAADADLVRAGSQTTMRPVEGRVSTRPVLIHDANDTAVDRDLGGPGVVESLAQPLHACSLEPAPKGCRVEVRAALHRGLGLVAKLRGTASSADGFLGFGFGHEAGFDKKPIPIRRRHPFDGR